MKTINYLELTFNYLKGCIAMIFVFWIISCTEVYFLSAKQLSIPLTELIFYKIINDVVTVLILGILFFPLYLLFTIVIKKWVQIIFAFIAVLLVFIQLSLVKYSLTTLLNLGADLLGYSYNDIFLTVSSSASFSFISVLPFIVVPLLFFGIVSLFGKTKNKKILVYGSLFLIIISVSVRFVFSKTNESVFQNKIYFLVNDIIKSKVEKNEVSNNQFVVSKEYPLLKNADEVEDVLGSFFNLTSQKPNIVFIIVEGLGGEFVGNFNYAGFTPFLDSLATKSLYWKNFVSTSGRTFGVLPSILGSLPYGTDGFLEITETPNHLSLLSILKENGYTTNYYTGSNSSFDRIINYLEFNGIDNVVDESKYGNSYKKAAVTDDGFSWGYPDSELFRKGLSDLNESIEPRLDIFLTVSNHEPFIFPNKEKYMVTVDKMINSNSKMKVSKEFVQAHKEIFASLLYTDESIKNFINFYKKRKDFANTIFIITGDHRLIPISQKDELCRYHVPFIISSPLLNTFKTFPAVSSHLDVTPSVVAFLQNNYDFKQIDSVSWLGNGLDIFETFRNKNKIPLMRYKGAIKDFIYKDYFISDGNLFKIDENFNTQQVSDAKMLQILSDSLAQFKRLNAYLIQNNKIHPNSKNTNRIPKIAFSKEQLAEIKILIGNADSDASYQIARKLAFEKDYKKGQLICDYIINELPNHADAIILKGRIYAWEGNYIEAEKAFLNAQKRAPFYDDAYLALLDTYWWAEQDEKSVAIVAKAMRNSITNPELSFKMAQGYVRMNKNTQAIKVIDSLLKKYPTNQTYKEFKNTLHK
ncbi:sulfatase-like hydrolase/transferase [Lutibacter sp.]|uniref:sulfatase-like hydrolase/transferase n=1 Tax=Lutibacter sp. TaxID=1925666 RepID=UPI002734DA44|nr:sulfatase-like hydrolase/transferase [Lutibacter sp.]MDP3312696.1 sulfatase-like hydrolase/transferase [Lutibacter sp.]